MSDLFASVPMALIADAEGGIRYWPELVGLEHARRWFDALEAGVEWRRERRRMYDRMVDVPRLLAAYDVVDLPPALPLKEMLERVKAVVSAPYNAVGLNLYRDGSDSVAMHNDKLHSIVAGAPIALVSLGSTRRMTLRRRAGLRESISVDLEPGSLLVMSHATQRTHEHGIPKTTRPVGPRMSVVFRVRPEDEAAGYRPV